MDEERRMKASTKGIENHARVMVLATGGTIAGLCCSSMSDAYTPGLVSIEQLLPAAHIADVDIISRQLFSSGSQDISLSAWNDIHAAVTNAFENDYRISGVVVTHGTDTIEETAFLLDLTVPRGLPVVLVGAMRPFDAIGTDGPRNLMNSIKVAASPSSWGRGVLVISGDNIFRARDVRKTRTVGVESFGANPLGPEGMVTPSSLTFFECPPPSDPYCLPIPDKDAWPLVAIIYCYAAMDRTVVDAILSAELKGVVIAGVGQGNAPAWLVAKLRSASLNGVAVVRSTRIDAGSVSRNSEINDTANGFVAGASLSPQKCRILLALLIAAGITEAAEQQQVFASIGGLLPFH